MPLTDTLNRSLRDLRISVTDRCNFRCVYCMPKEIFGPDHQFLHRDQILTFEEITRLARIFTTHGVRKIRLTGGEPLLRKDLPDLISMLAQIPDLDLTLTTNGSLLPKHAQALKDAGLKVSKRFPARHEHIRNLAKTTVRVARTRDRCRTGTGGRRKGFAAGR